MFDTATNWSLIGAVRSGGVGPAQMSAPEAVRAVSATSMREGMVLYDRDGKETWACPNATPAARRGH